MSLPENYLPIVNKQERMLLNVLTSLESLTVKVDLIMKLVNDDNKVSNTKEYCIKQITTLNDNIDR